MPIRKKGVTHSPSYLHECVVGFTRGYNLGFQEGNVLVECTKRTQSSSRIMHDSCWTYAWIV